jgi:predicted dehydrogenase
MNDWGYDMERRVFLGTLAAGTAALGSRRRAEGADAPLKLGLIGCGWYGGVVLKAAFEAGGVEVAALCDVDRAHLEKMTGEIAKSQERTPTTYADWRQLLEQEDLAAVVISTPPHWHALPFIEACRRGLDIYCEKPLAYDVREGQAMVDAAQAGSNVVQIGFQRRQSEALKRAAGYIGEGHAGKIVTAAAQIHYAANADLRDPTPKDPPASLDWDFWCGPAPKLPYSEQVGHFAWRLEKAYGNGHLVDWGIHRIDAIRVALGLGMPRSVTAAGGLYALKGRITTPDVLQVHFEFGECPVTWTHRIFGAAEYTPEINNGMSFFGEKESVFVSDRRFVVVPVEKEAERRVVEVKDNPQVAHVSEWLEAVRTRGRVSCPPEDAYQSTATVQLAMVALDTGGRVEWDAESGEIRGNPKAAALLKRDYRAPWVHPRKG